MISYLIGLNFDLGGEPAVVYWQSGAKHRGGYAYRLCKVNDGKIWEVTEECFQDGHLKFSGTNISHDS